MRAFAAVAAAFWVVLTAAGAAAGPTLDGVRLRGELRCGVNTGLAGFAQQDSQGRWTGIDIDVCKAVAAAILGSADKVLYVPLSAQQRFTALQSGEIDLLSRNTTWTLSRDAGQGMNFAPVVYYDGQGFMVERAAGVTSARELDGAAICVQQGTTTERNLADWFRAARLTYSAVVGETMEQINADFFNGRCDVLTTDASGLAAVRASVAHNPDDYLILPELISKEPLAPAVRHGDDQFFDIVKWVVYALIEAEEKGVTQANLEAQLKTADPAVRRLLGVQPELGAQLGLSEKWAYEVIRAVGNYGEVFDRNLGPATPFKLARGLNALWTQGGLMYAMPPR